MLLHFFIILILVIKKSISVAKNDELKDGKKKLYFSYFY